MASDAKSKKNPAAVALGRLGGLRGGPARAKMLTTAKFPRALPAREANGRTQWSVSGTAP